MSDIFNIILFFYYDKFSFFNYFLKLNQKYFHHFLKEIHYFIRLVFHNDLNLSICDFHENYDNLDSLFNYDFTCIKYIIYILIYTNRRRLLIV